jgi:uncharacterized protein (TIGR02285 family)
LASLLMTAAQGGDTIHWYTADFPPGHIERGPMAGEGYVDLMFKRVIEPALPQFTHVHLLAPLPRFAHDVTTRPDICSGATLRTPDREGKMLFSAPTLQFLPAGLIVRNDDVPSLLRLRDSKGRISLAAYLALPNVTICTVEGRAYGPQLDPLLAAASSKLQPVEAAVVGPQFVDLLPPNRRISAVIGLSFEPVYASQDHPELKGRLTWMPLAEQPKAITSHIACSRSPQGQRVIDAVNKVLARPGVRRDIQGFYDQWLDPTSRARLKAIIARTPANG